MVKGNICEKCQKRQATTDLDIQGWKKWIVCAECCKELQTCSKCKKNSATNLITEGKEKKQVCAECAKTEEEQNLKKCDDCKIKVATSHGASTEWGKFSLCESCYKKRNNKDKPVGDVKDFDEKWSKWTFSYENKKPINKLDSLEKIQQAKNELEPYLKTPDIINNSTSISRPDIQFFSPIPIKTNEDVNQVVNELTEMGIIKRKDDFMVLPDMEVVTVFFEKENNKEKVERVKDFIKILDWKAQKFDKPTDKGKEPPKDDKNKSTDKNHKPNPNELCEQCGASCVVHKTKTSYTIKRKRYIKHKTDFTRESSVWFGTNCDCARQFREANQQTCPQCKKREFPHMKRGWLLDYEIHKAFCSPLCHVTYRELQWEQAQRLTGIEMMPPELDVETNPGQNTDWEKEGLRREVLFWREYARELEQRLNNQSNLTPEERQQSNYLRNLQQNTLRNAENAYRERYGSLSEDGSDKGKGMSGGVIAVLIGGGIILIVGIIFLLTRKKNKRYE